MTSPMRACYVDANVLIYFKNEDSAYSSKATDCITSLVEKDFVVCLSALVIDEFLHGILLLLRYKKVNETNVFPILLRAIKDVLALPNLTFVNPPQKPEQQLQIVDFMRKYKLKPRDAYHLLTMKVNGISHFATFDEDFAKVFRDKLVLPYILS